MRFDGFALGCSTVDVAAEPASTVASGASTAAIAVVEFVQHLAYWRSAVEGC